MDRRGQFHKSILNTSILKIQRKGTKMQRRKEIFFEKAVFT